MRHALLAALIGLLASTSSRADEAALDSVFSDWRGRHRIDTAILVVEDRGRIVFEKASGTRRAGDRVLISSLSKAITASCAAVLIRDGKLRLDTKLEAVLAEEMNAAEVAANSPLRTVTVEELMIHRAGLGRDADRAFGAVQRRQLDSVAPSDVDIRAATVATLGSVMSLASRGRYDYSTFGYVLLGQAIERASGEPYATVCARTVLTPAGVANAGLDPVWGFRYAAGGWQLSGREYLAFLRHMPLSAEWVGATVAQWTLDPAGKESRAPVFYSLGILVRPTGGSYEILHSGALAWNQHSRKNGLLYNSTQAYAARNADGIGLFVFGEFCFPDNPGCFNDPGWSALSRQVFEATRR